MAPRILQEKDSTGKTIWVFTIGETEHRIDEWSKVLQILAENKDQDSAPAAGYGQGRYMGD